MLIISSPYLAIVIIIIPSLSIYIIRDSILEITRGWIQNPTKPLGFNVSLVSERWFKMRDLLEAFQENRVSEVDGNELIMTMIMV